MRNNLLVAAPAIDWLDQETNCTILHRFEHVVNLMSPDREIISISTPEVNLTPLTLQVDFVALDRFQQIDIKTALTLIRRDDQRLLLTSAGKPIWEWEKGQARLWDPKPEWQRLSDYRPSARSLSFCDHTLSHLTGEVTRAIGSGSWERAKKYAGLIIGRGPGLTPLGDDVMIGICHGVWVKAPQETYRLNVWIADLEERTTSLSAAMLRAAAAGEASRPWHALAKGEPGAVDKICAFGATSGEGAWFGFSQMIEALWDRR